MNKNTNQIIEYLKKLSDTRVLGILAFGVVALLVTWSGVSVVQTNFELDKKISIQRQENEIARLENENLKFRNVYFESDQYLELAARGQLGKAAPGEKLYIVPEEVALAKTVDRPADPKDAPVLEEEKPQYQRNLEAWSEFLFR